jgi:hypothetical protein
MPLTLDPLLKWAHGVGLLDGQRNRRIQLSVYAEMRNHFAHGGNIERLGMPPDSARAIHDLAEVINRLWGVRTAGGRIYPAPVARETLVLAWSDGWGAREAGSEFGRFRPDQLREDARHEWNCMVVLAPDVDQGLHDFDARYELTPYPVDWLWGPGTRQEAMAWLANSQSPNDEVTTIYRIFAVRVDEGRTYMPIRPELLSNLPEDRRSGTWHLVQADFPNDAHFHLRHLARREPCPEERRGGCPVTELASGNWADICADSSHLMPDAAPMRYVEACVPRKNSYPDDVGY